MKNSVDITVGDRKIIIETGELAKQANGTVLVTCEDTVVLSSAVASNEVLRDIDFFPLTVDYRERFYAAGRIPGGFIKRESRPAERETLISRLIDRSLRPLFDSSFRFDSQVVSMVLSADNKNSPDLLAIIGSSAALAVSDISFMGPVGAVRIGRIDGRFKVNPVHDELMLSDLNLVVSGTSDAIVMVEGGAFEVEEKVIVDAIGLAHEAIKEIVKAQNELVLRCGVPKRNLQKPQADPSIETELRAMFTDRIEEALLTDGKMAKQRKLEALRAEAIERIALGDESKPALIGELFSSVEKEKLRFLIKEKGLRVDGRSLEEIRPISCKIGVLPRAHGSALFTRGETQALVSVTLGTSEDEQRIDDIEGKSSKSFMLHYNFPSFSVGETAAFRGPGRREIGHGALAERAILPVIPQEEVFPYVIRIVSDILESNGSSSMASVCGSSLALMDAGVPVKEAVAGIAMGLIKEGDEFYILSDISGYEDHYGDMDFKVAGTEKGITAIQMDIKTQGVNSEVLSKALDQARRGRLLVLKKMNQVISGPRESLSVFAPRIYIMKVKSDKVREVIGPGGKVIRGIIEETGVAIDVEDDGTIKIISNDSQMAQKAMDKIKTITQEAEVGKIYLGKVRKITDFGAFVEIFPGTDGLIHISQIADYRVKSVADELKENDEVLVKVLEVDKLGRVKLSRKDALRDSRRENEEHRQKFQKKELN